LVQLPFSLHSAHFGFVDPLFLAALFHGFEVQGVCFKILLRYWLQLWQVCPGFVTFSPKNWLLMDDEFFLTNPLSQPPQDEFELQFVQPFGQVLHFFVALSPYCLVGQFFRHVVFPSLK
jgi:hypothetical protein